ncbi:hypothetical protein BD560DRAFT_372028 [Blakeslea trispora]|nr:hypothetical protein BD560DRAFT_372028 [Blakeslea trispora]
MPNFDKQLPGEGKTYITLQYLSRLALWGYFRQIKVICKQPVPAEGPLLVAANHSNMVLDPIVLIATFPHSRACHFWALARFFRIPIVGSILKAAGVLPVDTKTHSNAKLFEHTLQSLDQGAVVALFPEGTSYTAPNHLPFKDGISWASFEYLTQLNQKESKRNSISIIPVGITYTNKNRWRSQMVVEYGEPIVKTIDDLKAFELDPKKHVKQLTDQIAKGVESSTINSPDWDTTHAAKQARFILFGDSKNVPLDQFVRLSQSFIRLFHPHQLHEKERLDLRNRLLLLSQKLRSLQLNAWDIDMYEHHEITATKACLRLISTWTSLVIQMPLFLPGMLINSPFYLLGRLIDSYEPYTESVSQDKLIFSFFLAIPVYGSLIWCLTHYTGYGLLLNTLCILMLLPLFAWYHMALIDTNYDMLKRAIASWRIFVAIVHPEDQNRVALEECVSLRKWCREQTRALMVRLADSGDLDAQMILHCIN